MSGGIVKSLLNTVCAYLYYSLLTFNCSHCHQHFQMSSLACQRDSQVRHDAKGSVILQRKYNVTQPNDIWTMGWWEWGRWLFSKAWLKTGLVPLFGDINVCWQHVSTQKSIQLFMTSQSAIAIRPGWSVYADERMEARGWARGLQIASSRLSAPP